MEIERECGEYKAGKMGASVSWDLKSERGAGVDAIFGGFKTTTRKKKHET